MGAIKPNKYTQQELSISLVADAISHPFRARVIQKLNDDQFLRNIDLAKIFCLNPTTIKNHLEKLKNANLIYFEYHSHYYEIKLNTINFTKLKVFFNMFNDGEIDFELN